MGLVFTVEWTEKKYDVLKMRILLDEMAVECFMLEIECHICREGVICIESVVH